MAAAPRPLIREAPARGKSCQDRHQAYLQLLQERNRSLRQLKAQDRSRQAELEQRERGFSTHFSGANAARTRRKGSQSSLSPLGVVGRSGSGGEGVGGSKQWEVNTVEIKGEDGEVFAVRPGLDLRPLPESDTLEDSGPVSLDNTMEATLKGSLASLGMSQQTQGSLADDCKDLAAELEALEKVNDWENSDGSEDGANAEDRANAESQVPEEVGEVVKATLTGTREELQDLREALAAEGIVAKDEAEVPEADPPSISPGQSGPEPVPAEEQGSSGQEASPKSSTKASTAAATAAATMSADVIAQRIAQLDESWKGALLQLLDEAEAAAAARASSTAPAASGSSSHPDPAD